ncbi:MAG TPA: M56 family metallopeptidase, partial [Thermoanaerobaculia bacterium]|nr:M56 family metallopeptidase [Thermoanaerobaculia bacterium]
MPMMVGAALVGILVTLVLFAIVLAVGPRRPTLRHRILVLGSAVLIGGPLISVVIPAGSFPAWLTIDVPRSIELRKSGGPEVLEGDAVFERGSSSADGRLLTPNDFAMTMPERVIERSFFPLLGIIWLAGVIIGFLHLLDSLRSLRRLSRWSSEADELLVLDCRNVCAALSIAPVRLLTSAEIDIPMTWGLISPRILVPVDAATWPASRRTAVLLHESAHICRRDSVAKWMLRLSCIFFWWNPLVWCLARIAHRDAELACDARVLETGFSPRAYAEELV